MKKYIGYFLIVVIIIFCSLTFYGYKFFQQDIKNTELMVGKNVKRDIDNKINKANFNDQKIDSLTAEQFMKVKQKKVDLSESVVGQIAIPKIKLMLPVLAGVTDENLATGATMYSRNQQLGKNNYILMTHNIVNAGLLFTRIDELKNNNLIYITNGDDVYTYSVFLNKIISQYDTKYIEINSQRPIITLIRCEGDYGTTKRRVVQGQLVKKESISEFKNDVFNIGKNSGEGLLQEKDHSSFLTRIAEQCAKLFLENQILVFGVIILLIVIIFKLFF